MNKTAYFNRFEIELPIKCVEDCSGSGQKYDICKFWAQKLNLIIDPEKLKKELAEYGGWDDTELRSHEENMIRIIWVAAGNIKDNN